MTAAELQEKIKDLPPDATVTFGTSGNETIIALAFIGAICFIFWLMFRD